MVSQTLVPERTASETATDQDAAAPARAVAEPVARSLGAIVLARHGEPALSRRIKLDSAGYRRWWATYEEGGLLEGQTPPARLVETAQNAGSVLASTRRRSLETAKAVCGERPFDADQVFIEAPLPPPALPSFLKFSPRTWGVIARFWWWAFNHHQGEESRDQAKTRAREAADRLVAHATTGGDVLLLAHGFFNTMVGVELQKMGWRLVQDEGWRYWSARRFEKKSAAR
jgi:broad specificity phosphatase PhoE